MTSESYPASTELETQGPIQSQHGRWGVDTLFADGLRLFLLGCTQQFLQKIVTEARCRCANNREVFTYSALSDAHAPTMMQGCPSASSGLDTSPAPERSPTRVHPKPGDLQGLEARRGPQAGILTHKYPAAPGTPWQSQGAFDEEAREEGHRITADSCLCREHRDPGG